MAITILGLGPGGSQLLTRQAWDVLNACEIVYLRTARHPAVAGLPAHLHQISYDHIYETAADFAEVYRRIAADVVRLGKEAEDRQSTIVYAVPGHPYVGEATVTAIVEAAAVTGIPVTIIPGLSFVEPTLTAVGLDALDGLQIIDAIEFAGYHYPPTSSDLPLVLGQVYNQLLASELKLTLMTVYPDDHETVLVHAAGTGDQSVERVPLHLIDHSPNLAHLTSLYVPPLPQASTLAALAETVAHLRGPDGCPWDQEQTPQSMRSGFLEEMGEVLAALDATDPESLAEELGDLLYHLVMQAQMAAEDGDFSLADVIAGIDSKLKRRHPHVWGDWQVADSNEVIRNWEMIKAKEKALSATPSLVDNISMALPALARAQKIQERVRKVGFDWPDKSGVVDKLLEEIGELKEASAPDEVAAELGDVLFAMVNLARWLEVDAETALREANFRFGQRFRKLEALTAERGLSLEELDLVALDSLWEEAKRALAGAADNEE
jgi:tetrapyrrole methylase family protein / MazG family protein